MTRQAQRWQIWKIATATAGCAVLSTVLFWLPTLVGTSGGEQPKDPLTRNPVLTLTSFTVMLAAAAAILSILGLIWLVVRIREARTPVWQRKRKKRRY